MEIRDLHLSAIAQFDEVQLGLGTGLHVLYGSNETGKSTLLALLIDLLFGGTPANRDWYSGNSRLAATLVHGTDNFELRRKRFRAQLVEIDQGDKPVQVDLMTQLFGMQRQRYMQLYGFDHERLRTGGQSLLAADGDAGISLFEAGSGSAHVKQWIDGYKGRISELFHPAMRTNSTALLNRALRDYQEAKARQRQAQLRPSVWLAEQSSLREAELRVEQLASEIATVKRELTKIERIRRGLPLFQKRQHLLGQLEAYAGTPTIGERQDGEIRAMLQEVSQLTELLEQESVRLERAQEKLEGMATDRTILQEASELEALREKFALYTSTAKELGRLRENLVSAQAEVETAAASLLPEPWNSHMALSLMTHSSRQALERLAENAGQSLQQMELLARQLAEAQSDLADQAANLEKQINPPDVSALRGRIQSWRSEGLSSEQVIVLESRFHRRQIELQEMLKQQSVWSGEPEDILTLPIPGLETILRYVESLRHLELAAQSCRASFEQATSTQTRLQMELRGLESVGWLPTESDLVEARRHRDEGWFLVKTRLKNPAIITLDDAAYTDGLPSLEDAYERAARRADDTVDRLRQEADQIAKRTEYLSQLEQQKLTCDKYAAELERLTDEVAELETSWKNEWALCGISPKRPGEMQAWVQQWLIPFKRELEDLRRVEKEMSDLAVAVERADAELGSWSQLYGIVTPTELKGFDDKLAYVEAQLVGFERARLRRKSLEEAVEQADRKVRQYHTQEDIHRQRHSEVVRKYEEIRKDHLFLPANIEDCPSYLVAYDKLVHQVERYLADTRLRDQKEQHVKEFEGRVGDIAAKLLGEEANRMDAATLYHQLQLRLQEAKSAESQRDRQETLITTQQERVNEVSETLLRAQTQLMERASLFQQTTPQGLVKLLDLAAEKRALTSEVEQIEASMVVAGDGHSLRDVLEELNHVDDVDAIPPLVDELRLKIADLEGQLSDGQISLGQKKQAIAQMDGTVDEAAKAAQEAAIASDMVATYWEELMRVQTELTLLEQALSVYRDRNQNGMIESAGQTFRRITCERYAGIELDDDPSAPRLLAIDANGNRRAFNELSDGTMDQLHFALRLAFLQAQVGAGTSMPLIMDDVFIHFDDERTAATLKVLDELAGQVQILYFTHHKHLVEQILPQMQLAQVKTHELAHSIRYRKG